MVKLMFCWPYGPDDIAGGIIQDFEGIDEPTHVAIVLEYGLLEAQPQGVVYSDTDKYKQRRREIWGISAPHEELSAVAVQVLLGKHYSWLSCVLGGLRVRWGIKFPWFDSGATNCSEAGTEYLAMLGRNLFGTDAPAGITPAELLGKIKYVGGVQIEKSPC